MAVTCTADYLGEASKCLCFDPITAEKVKIYLLAELAGLTSLTPSQLAEAAECYCFDPVTMKKVLAYLLCQIANNGASTTCEMLTGTSDPTGSITPEFIGQLFHDTANDKWYYSTGLTSADWTEISGAAPACVNVEGAGDPT